MSQPTFKDGLGYEGKVTLTLKSNGRVLESRTYKNSGTTHLFSFLGYCLANDFVNARRLLPAKIKLLYNDKSSPAHEFATSVKSRSSYQGLSQQPTIIANELDKVRVVYSFEVPKTAIMSKVSGDNNQVVDAFFNQVALYRDAATEDEDSPDGIKSFSAYYFLTNGTVFDPQSPVSWSPSTTLFIEWELIISNKNEE